MTEGSISGSTGSTDGGADVPRAAVDEAAGVRLTYLPQPSDTLAGLRVRARVKRTGLWLRWAFAGLWVGQWLLATVGRGSADAVSTLLTVFVVLMVWGYPRTQAAQVQRLVGWQGEYRVTVSPAGVSCTNDHSTLAQKWSLFRGYREARDHFVLLSRDPNIMCLDVLPKRGAREAGDLDRLRALLDEHTARV
ncbi:YcxB family protein [Streptomyces sp. NBC_00059]|uniref:YcxB family protein n=1 Tax=Streptomyces sp. NBC_00059 TaxID=2975635 RepID=UPI00225AA6C5|nr:YcxB family protein [Streptomyces sp. NBC_00059]MCX5413553.1 YcxB family protein [Streptomyces sp. NBC_00059]